MVFLNAIVFSILALSLAQADTWRPCHPSREISDLARTDRPEVILFDIDAHTVPCEAVAPTRCLVVNGEYFYGVIDGYRHIEGQPARIYVERTERPEPVPADVGAFLYRRIDKR